SSRRFSTLKATCQKTICPECVVVSTAPLQTKNLKHTEPKRQLIQTTGAAGIVSASPTTRQGIASEPEPLCATRLPCTAAPSVGCRNRWRRCAVATPMGPGCLQGTQSSRGQPP